MITFSGSANPGVKVLLAILWTIVLLFLGMRKKELHLNWYVGIDMWVWMAIYGLCISGMLCADPSGYLTEIYHSVAYQGVIFLAYALALIQGSAFYIYQRLLERGPMLTLGPVLPTSSSLS